MSLSNGVNACARQHVDGTSGVWRIKPWAGVIALLMAAFAGPAQAQDHESIYGPPYYFDVYQASIPAIPQALTLDSAIQTAKGTFNANSLSQKR